MIRKQNFDFKISVFGMDCEEKTLKSPDFGTNFVKKLQELWKYGKLCDSEIEVGSRVFKFHRIVLAVASPSFLESNNGVMTDRLQIQLPIDTDLQVLDNLLNYLYGKDLKVTSQQVATLLKLGNLFRINTINEFCKEFAQESDTKRASTRKRGTHKPESIESDKESESPRKKRILSGKFPAPVLKRNCARRGAKSIRGSRTASPVVSPKIATTKLRGRGRGRGRGCNVSRSSIRSPVRLLANNHLKNAANICDTSNNYTKSYSSRKSKRTSTVTSSASKDSKSDDHLKHANEDSCKDTDQPQAPTIDIRSILRENASTVVKPNGYLDVKGLADSLGIKPYSTRYVGKNKKGQKKAVAKPPIDMLNKPNLDVKELQSLSMSDLQILMRRQLNIEKQRRYRDKMKHDPEYRRKEAERVKRRYVPITKCSIKERQRRRTMNNEYVRRSRLRKKFSKLQTSEMITDIENNEHYSGELFVPQDSEFYLCNNLENNIDYDGHNTGELQLDVSAIKQEVPETVSDSNYVLEENHFDKIAVSETTSENVGEHETQLTNGNTSTGDDNRELITVVVENEAKSDNDNNVEDQVDMETHSMETTAIVTHTLGNPLQVEAAIVNDTNAVEDIPETITYHMSEDGENLIEEQSNFDNCSSFQLRNSESSNYPADVNINVELNITEDADQDVNTNDVNET
ncbi:hypothetical protein ACF0H5_015769 [Mactra antiquata]